jgi:hypothetical protein
LQTHEVSCSNEKEAEQDARANDHGRHASCSEQHEPRQPRSWLILNVRQKMKTHIGLSHTDTSGLSPELLLRVFDTLQSPKSFLECPAPKGYYLRCSPHESLSDAMRCEYARTEDRKWLFSSSRANVRAAICSLLRGDQVTEASLRVIALEEKSA